MAEKIAFENGSIFNFQRARDLDLDLGSGHTAYLSASIIDLYLQDKFYGIDETFSGRTDGQTFENGSIRSTQES